MATTATTDPATALPPLLSPEQFIELGRSSVVRLRNDGCTESGVGTAFLVDGDQLVSNWHVVEGFRSLSMSTWDGSTRVLDGVPRSGGTFDVAVLDVGPVGLHAIPSRAERPEVGEQLVVLGYPRGGDLAVTVAFLERYENRLDGEFLRLDVSVVPGSSGSPVVDTRGRVVGIVAQTDFLEGNALVLPYSKVVHLPEREWVDRPPC